MTTAVIIAGSVAAPLLFVLFFRRLKSRSGPAAGALQAALLAGAISLLGASAGLRVLARPAAPTPPLFALVDEEVIRESPDLIRAEFARMPQGTPVRTAIFTASDRDTRRARTPSEPLASLPSFRPEARFSSLTAALAWAGIEGRERALPQVVVFTQRRGPAVAPAGMAVTSVSLAPPATRTSITRFDYPPLVFSGRPVTVRVSFRPPPGKYSLHLFVDDALRLEFPDEEAGAQPERRNMRFPLSAGEADGAHRLSFVIRADQGRAIDHRYGSFTVRPLPRLRYYSAAPAGPLPLFLRSAGYPVASGSLEELAGADPADGADIVLLDDIPSVKLPWTVVSTLYRAAFRGTGILVVGGRRSFTLGGYGDTPAERLLPLSMGVKNPDREKHRSALVIVLDTSGSMFCPPEGCPTDKEWLFGQKREARGPRVMKIDLAKQALIDLLPAMKAVDWFGILGVRTAPYWEVEPGTLANRDAVAERVRQIKASGDGINLYSALLEASKRIVGLDAELKHIVALIDTDDIDEIRVAGLGSVEDLVASLAKDRVSVSFIGFGFPDDRYVPLLNQLAASTGGFLYLSSDITQVPRFLAEDRESLSRRQTIRRHQRTRHEEDAFPGLEETPSIEEQFITEAKDDARTLVWTELGYPLFALRRVERGAVGAFAADNGRNMAPDWVAAPARAAWDEMLGSLLPRDPEAERLFVGRSGERVVAYYRSEAAGGPGSIQATVSGGDRDREVPFREVFPKTWRADLGALRPGSYAVGLRDAAGRAAGVALEVRPPERPVEENPVDYATLVAPAARASRAVDESVVRLILLLTAGLVVAYEIVRQR